jgi:hypothetical protein
VRWEDPDTDAFGGLNEAQRLQYADSLTDHRTGYFELVFQLFCQHDMARGKAAADDSGSQMLNGTMVEAG